MTRVIGIINHDTDYYKKIKIVLIKTKDYSGGTTYIKFIITNYSV